MSDLVKEAQLEEEEKKKVAEDKAKVAEERAQLEKERAQLEKERAQFEKERAQHRQQSPCDSRSNSSRKRKIEHSPATNTSQSNLSGGLLTPFSPTTEENLNLFSVNDTDIIN